MKKNNHRPCLTHFDLNYIYLQLTQIYWTAFLIIIPCWCMLDQVHSADTSSLVSATVPISPQYFHIGPISCDITSNQTEIIEKSLELFLYNPIKTHLKDNDLFGLDMKVNNMSIFEHEVIDSKGHTKNDRKLRVPDSHRKNQVMSANFLVESTGLAYFHNPPSLDLLNTAVERIFKEDFDEMLLIIKDVEQMQLPSEIQCFSAIYQDNSSVTGTLAIPFFVIGGSLGVLLITYMLFVMCRGSDESKKITLRPEVENSISENIRSLELGSNFVYLFADILTAARGSNPKLELDKEKLGDYTQGRIDLTQNILSIQDLGKIDIIGQDDKMLKLRHDFERELKIIKKQMGEGLHLVTFNSFFESHSCVYAILKNTKKKRIMITFRGSVMTGTRDWQMNFYNFMKNMETPPLVSKKLEAEYEEYIMVHKGFHSYLFDQIGEQVMSRMEKIIMDVQNIFEDGYRIYVTGHSLGGALATLASFHLAGLETFPDSPGNSPDRLSQNFLKKRGKENINRNFPKPITAITFESPYVGSEGFQLAFQQMEKDGLVRHLRVTNVEDSITYLPSMTFKMKKFKHVGVHLRLHSNKFVMEHGNPRLARHYGLRIKNFCFGCRYHKLETTRDRIEKYKDILKSCTIEDLYKNVTKPSRNTVNWNEFI